MRGFASLACPVRFSSFRLNQFLGPRISCILTSSESVQLKVECGRWQLISFPTVRIYNSGPRGPCVTPILRGEKDTTRLLKSIQSTGPTSSPRWQCLPHEPCFPHPPAHGGSANTEVTIADRSAE